jgi:hypothetical protein
MYSRTLLARVERVEQLAKAKTKFLPDCICWPDNEQPFFGFDIEREIAAAVKCPIHGERTHLIFQRLFLPAWRREREAIRRPLLSPQYQKAWNASFPPELWPAEEEETADGEIFLRLKDGTSLLACQSRGCEKPQQHDQTGDRT